MDADIAVVYWIDFDELADTKKRLQVLPITSIKSLVSDLPVVKYSICRAGSSSYSFCVVLDIFTGSSLLNAQEKLVVEHAEWEAKGKRICGQPKFLPQMQLKNEKVLRSGTRTRGAYRKEAPNVATDAEVICEEPHRMVPRGTSKRQRT